MSYKFIKIKYIDVCGIRCPILKAIGLPVIQESIVKLNPITIWKFDDTKVSTSFRWRLSVIEKNTTETKKKSFWTQIYLQICGKVDSTNKDDDFTIFHDIDTA